MLSFTSEASTICTLHFLAQNTSKMHLGQKNEVTSLKAFTIKKIHNLKLEDEAKLVKGK